MNNVLTPRVRPKIQQLEVSAFMAGYSNELEKKVLQKYIEGKESILNYVDSTE